MKVVEVVFDEGVVVEVVDVLVVGEGAVVVVGVVVGIQAVVVVVNGRRAEVVVEACQK